MRSRYEIYQAKIDACRQHARSSPDDMQRDRWTRLAEQWSKMMTEAERPQRKPAPLLTRSSAARRSSSR